MPRAIGAATILGIADVLGIADLLRIAQTQRRASSPATARSTTSPSAMAIGMETATASSGESRSALPTSAPIATL